MRKDIEAAGKALAGEDGPSPHHAGHRGKAHLHKMEIERHQGGVRIVHHYRHENGEHSHQTEHVVAMKHPHDTEPLHDHVEEHFGAPASSEQQETPESEASAHSPEFLQQAAQAAQGGEA